MRKLRYTLSVLRRYKYHGWLPCHPVQVEKLEETQKLISGECRKENIARKKSDMKNRFFSNFYLECSVQLELELEIRVSLYIIDVEAGQKLKFKGLEYSKQAIKANVLMNVSLA